MTGPGGAAAVARLDRWEQAHPGWSVEYHADLGYWEALRRREAQVVSVCRTDIGKLLARVDEVLAAEAACG